MALDAESQGSFKIKSLEQARRLIENLVFTNSTKNADLDKMKLAGNMDGGQITEV